VKQIAIVTVSRSDYSIYLPVLKLMHSDPLLSLNVIVGGTHLSPHFGSSAESIEQDGFNISARVDTLTDSESPQSITRSMGLAINGFASAYSVIKPDMLVLVGDRFEMHSAASAAVPFNIPISHIHGGEITEGAIDDALRHSITKLSHLHFVSTESHAKRVLQMGEEPWRVTLCGAPSLDNLYKLPLLNKSQILERFGISMDPAPLLITYHPVTLQHDDTEEQTIELLSAIEQSKLPTLFTIPNVDIKGSIISTMIQAYTDSHNNSHMIPNFGTEGYFSVMSHCAAMVGNSSSGIIEAASLKIPVVNVGTRQQGRTRGANVIDVDCNREAILSGIRYGVSELFRSTLSDIANPYGDGSAAEIVVDKIKNAPPHAILIRKKFNEHLD
tara:strand:+ start:16542 stop:17699 length:1158 start_codon:yes stop_codon:yes gene_type:complete